MMMTIIALFIAVVIVASLLFEELRNRVECLLEYSIDDSQLSTALSSWNRHHHLVCSMVDCINKTFGLIILIQLGHIVMEWTIDCAMLMTIIRLIGVEYMRVGLVSWVVILLHILSILLVLILPNWIFQNVVCAALVAFV